MSDQAKTTSGRQRVLIALVASLAVIAFIESYQGLYHAAAAGGRPMPWLWPCAVEGFTLAMNVAIWDARSGHRKAPWAWFLLILATAVSTVLQVLDVLEGGRVAGHAGALGVLTAAWTPVALLLSFERWMWLAYAGRGVAPAENATFAPVAAISRPVATRSRPARRKASGGGRGARTQEARAFIEARRAGGGARPAGLHLQVRDEFGLERTYAKRLVDQLWPDGHVPVSSNSKEGSAA